MKKAMKTLAVFMVMMLALTGSVPTVTEAKAKTSIIVTNKSTGKKIGKKVSVKKGKKLQLKVKYGKNDVTKKAKYKTSNKKVVTVSKKGKITAKKVGSCTIKVTYKKKTKKIVVKVTNNVTTKKPSTENKEPSTENKESTTKEDTTNKTIETKDCGQESDPHPECDHEWIYPSFYSDPPMSYHFYLTEEDTNHFYLFAIYCKKCKTIAETKPISYVDTINYTNADYTNAITYYLKAWADMPKHKHDKITVYTRLPGGSWSVDPKCSICHTGFSGDN